MDREVQSPIENRDVNDPSADTKKAGNKPDHHAQPEAEDHRERILVFRSFGIGYRALRVSRGRLLLFAVGRLRLEDEIDGYDEEQDAEDDIELKARDQLRRESANDRPGKGCKRE